jgi:hypothetical protein
MSNKGNPVNFKESIQLPKCYFVKFVLGIYYTRTAHLAVLGKSMMPRQCAA